MGCVAVCLACWSQKATGWLGTGKQVYSASGRLGTHPGGSAVLGLSLGLLLPWTLESELKPDVAEGPGMPTCWRPGTQPVFPVGMETVRERETEPGCSWKQLIPPLLHLPLKLGAGRLSAQQVWGGPRWLPPPSLAVLGVGREGLFQPPMNLWGCQ